MGYSHKNSVRGGSHLTEQLLSIASGSGPLRLVCVCAPLKRLNVSARMRQQCSPPAFSYSSTVLTAQANIAHTHDFCLGCSNVIKQLFSVCEETLLLNM